jgi:hypothetical protein
VSDIVWGLAVIILALFLGWAMFEFLKAIVEALPMFIGSR